VTAVNRGEQLDPLVPILWHLAEIQARLTNRLQYLGYLAAAGSKQTAMSAFNLGHGSSPSLWERAIPKSVHINRELHDVEFLVPKQSFDGRADLPFI
jgi:hypothetical protein